MSGTSDEERTHSICVQRKEKKGLYRLQSYWDDNEINITLLDGSFAFNSTITKNELLKQSSDLNMKYDDYISKVYSALRNERCADIFLYERQQETFYIYRQVRTIGIKLAIFKLKQIDYSEAAEMYVDKLNQVAHHYKEMLEKSSHDHKRAIEEKNQVDNKLGEFVKLKQEVESELYSRFLLLLNEKKKRIAHLMQVIDALKNGVEPDEDYELIGEQETLKGKGKGKSKKDEEDINKEIKKPSSWDLNSDDEKASTSKENINEKNERISESDSENDKSKNATKIPNNNNWDSDTDEDLMRRKPKEKINKSSKKQSDDNKNKNITKTQITSRSSWDSDTDEDLIREYTKEKINKNSKKDFETNSDNKNRSKQKINKTQKKSSWDLNSDEDQKTINPFAIKLNNSAKNVESKPKKIETISGSDSESEAYARVTQKWNSANLEQHKKRPFEAIFDSDDSKPDPKSDYKTTESESNTDCEDTFGKVTHKVQIELEPTNKRKFDLLDLDDFSPPKISLPKRKNNNDLTVKTIDDINKITLASPTKDDKHDSQDLFDDNDVYTYNEESVKMGGKGDEKDETQESESLDFCTQDLLDRL